MVKAKPKQNYKSFWKIINTRFIGMSIISKYIPFGIFQFWVCELEFLFVKKRKTLVKYFARNTYWSGILCRTRRPCLDPRRCFGLVHPPLLSCWILRLNQVNQHLYSVDWSYHLVIAILLTGGRSCCCPMKCCQMLGKDCCIHAGYSDFGVLEEVVGGLMICGKRSVFY